MPKNSYIWYKIVRRTGFILLALTFVVLLYMFNINRFNKSPAPKVLNNYIQPYLDSNVADSTKQEARQKRNIVKKDNDSSKVNLDSIRRNIMRQSILYAERIAKSSGVDEAHHIVEFLKSNLILARPDAGAISSIDSSSKPFLGFVTVLPVDQMPSANWKKIVDSLDGINYFPFPNNCIVVDENNLQSGTIKGLMLLLSGSYTQVADKRNYTDNWFYHNQDRKAHEMINKVLLNIGGEKYTRLLENEITRLENIRDSSNYPIWPGRVQYPNELNELFSATTSLEIDFIRRLFWIHAVFALIDKPQTVSKQAKDFEKNDFLDFPYLRKW